MNNNLTKSLEKRCYCGRYISLGELKAGIGVFVYRCPDCLGREYSREYSNRYQNRNIKKT